jgi:hypothetical protein
VVSRDGNLSMVIAYTPSTRPHRDGHMQEFLPVGGN